MEQKNQIDNQIENQIDFNLNNNFDKNIACSIFLEQLNLINQLPIEERGNVLYLSLLNAFRECSKNQIDNQIDNQIEKAYISISISLSKSLSILSKTVLDLMNKTLSCKVYSSNYGGKRKNAGRPKKECSGSSAPTREEIENYCKELGKRINIDDFIAYYDATDWKDDLGQPIVWKRKVLKFAQSYNPEDEQKEKHSKAFDEFYKKEKARLAAKGIY